MDNKVMHKRHLVDEVARRSGPWELRWRQVRDALHGILDVLTNQMAEAESECPLRNVARLTVCWPNWGNIY